MKRAQETAQPDGSVEPTGAMGASASTTQTRATRRHNDRQRNTLGKGLRGRMRGSSAVEFALLAPLLLLLLFVVVDFGVLFWVNLTMQYAVREGARYAVTGQSNLDPNAASQQRYLAIVQQIRNSSMGLYDAVSPTYVVTINGATKNYASSGSYTSGMFGSPGDIVVLQLNCTWPLMTPFIQPMFAGGKYNFSVAATMRNEGF